MSKRVELEELMALAIKGEEDAKDFYLRMAKGIKNDLVRTKYEVLAKEEDSHRLMLLWLYRKLTGEDAPPKTEGAPRTAEVGSSDGPQGMQQLLELAIERERAAQRFYKDLATKMEDMENRRILEYLADIEAGHETTLMTELDAFKRDSIWYEKNL